MRLYEEKLAEKRISYILNPEELRRRRIEPIREDIIPIPPHESRNAENIRITNQKRRDDDYKLARERYENDLRKIQEAFGLAIPVLTSYCSEEIKQDIYSHLATPDLIGRPNEDRYNTALKRLRERWGPSDQTDIEYLRGQLLTLDGDTLGFEQAVLKFDGLVSAMAQTPKRGPDGNIEYHPTQPVLPDPLPLDATEQQRLEWRIAVGQAYEVAMATRGPAKNHKPSDEQLKEYILCMLGKSKQAAYRNLYTDAVKEENRAWTWESIRQNILNIAKQQARDRGSRGYKRRYDYGEYKGAHEAHRESKRTRHHEGRYADSSRKDMFEEERSRSRSRSASSQQRDQRHSHPGEQQAKCNNCGNRGHFAKDCPEPKCGICGQKFNTATERKVHWIDTHRKHVMSNLSREDRRSRSPGRYDKRYPRSRSNSRSPGRTPSYRHAHSSSRSDYGSESTTGDF